MVYKLTQELNSKDLSLPHTTTNNTSNRSSRRPSKESINNQTPREKSSSVRKQQ
jgi:hypothetical protein